MPRPRGYDLDELRAAWESSRFTTASEVMEFLGIDQAHARSVRANIRKYYGRRPRAAAQSIREDAIKRAVINHLVEAYHLRRDYCSQCQTYCGTDVYVRQLGHMEDKLDSCVIIGKCCKRSGDY
jgi:hypothetical protein